MTEFDVKSFITQIEQEHEIRVGRSMLSLMRDFKSSGTFECALAPRAFGMHPRQLMATVERIIKKVHLNQFASVSFDGEKKVAVIIKASDLQASAAQTNIATMLGQIHQDAAQLGI